MAILYQATKGEIITSESVGKVIRTSLTQRGLRVRDADILERTDGPYDYHVLGVADYAQKFYDILHLDQQIRKEDVPLQTLFDFLGIDYIDGSVKFTERWELVPGLTPPIAELYHNPTADAIELLRTTAREFKREQPGLDVVALSYYPSHETGFVYEKI